MRLINMTCPNCGSQLQIDLDNKQATCQYCGNALLIDDGVQHIQYDNAEKAGYEFEKGRQRAQAEQANRQVSQTATVKYWQQPQQQKKNNTMVWWVLGWIFFFPIPLTILLVRNKTMNPKVKYGIIAGVWIIVLLIGIAGNAGNNNTTVDSNTTDQMVSEEVTTELSTESTPEEQAENISTETSEESADITEVINPVELNSLQKLFAELSVDTTRDSVDAYIEENGFVKYAFSSDSAYYIGYDNEAIRERGRDREGEAIDIDFITSGDSETLGKVKSAKYTVHTGSSTSYLLKYEDGKFYYDGSECKDGNEAMQLYIANNDVTTQSSDKSETINLEFVENSAITDVVKYIDSNQSADSDAIKVYAESKGLTFELSDLGWGGGNHTYKISSSENNMDYISVYYVNPPENDHNDIFQKYCLSYEALTERGHEVLYYYSEWNRDNYSDEKYGYFVGDETFDNFDDAYTYYKGFAD